MLWRLEYRFARLSSRLADSYRLGQCVSAKQLPGGCRKCRGSGIKDRSSSASYKRPALGRNLHITRAISLTRPPQQSSKFSPQCTPRWTAISPQSLPRPSHMRISSEYLIVPAPALLTFWPQGPPLARPYYHCRHHWAMRCLCW